MSAGAGISPRVGMSCNRGPASKRQRDTAYQSPRGDELQLYWWRQRHELRLGISPRVGMSCNEFIQSGEFFDKYRISPRVGMSCNTNQESKN